MLSKDNNLKCKHFIIENMNVINIPLLTNDHFVKNDLFLIRNLFKTCYEYI